MSWTVDWFQHLSGISQCTVVVIIGLSIVIAWAFLSTNHEELDDDTHND